LPISVTLNIRRFDPEKDSEPYWQDFDVELYATDRVLDALHKIKWEQDGSLTFRRSCAHGICGSDAMRINGRNRLACKTLIKDLQIGRASCRGRKEVARASESCTHLPTAAK